MSTAATSPASSDAPKDSQAGTRPDTPSPAAHKPIPFGRLLAVETRKLADTRGAIVLHLVIAALVVALVVLSTSIAGDQLTFQTAATIAQAPLTFLLPVVGVLIGTGEWTHRSAMVTFTLEPRRHRVLLAKLVVTIVVAVLYFAWVCLLSAIVTAVAGSPDGAWDATAGTLGAAALVLVAKTLGGFALGLVLGSRTAAIVLVFALPILMEVLGAWKATAALVPWLSTDAAYGPVSQGFDLMTSTEWARAGVAFGVWVVLVGVVGFVINMRREAK